MLAIVPNVMDCNMIVPVLSVRAEQFVCVSLDLAANHLDSYIASQTLPWAKRAIQQDHSDAVLSLMVVAVIHVLRNAYHVGLL